MPGTVGNPARCINLNARLDQTLVNVRQSAKLVVALNQDRVLRTR